jgi:hypothetical protein
LECNQLLAAQVAQVVLELQIVFQALLLHTQLAAQVALTVQEQLALTELLIKATAAEVQQVHLVALFLVVQVAAESLL